MTRFAPALIALVVVVASGVAHGVRTHRWSGSGEFDARVAAVDRVPHAIGTWVGTDLPLDQRVRQAAGIAGHLMRRYNDQRTGREVMVLLVCGRPGPIAVHSPEICYEGSGYEPTDSRSKVAVDAGPPPEEFWVSSFKKPRAGFTERLQIYYAWSQGGRWVASDYPRFQFGGAPGLYKLYVVREGSAAASEADPAVEFLRAALPVLRTVLEPAPA